MSGASAIASARRRRTTPEPPIQSNQQNQETQSNTNNRQQLMQETITPLELLKQHEYQLSDLDNIITNKVETLVTKKLEELNLSKNNTNKENNSNSDLNDNIREFINNEISYKITSINDTIKSILLNIEKLGELSNLNNNYIKNLDELKGDINTLKMLLIKNQTLALETHTDMLKMKEVQTIQDKNLENINNSINNQNNSLKDIGNENIFQNLLMASLNRTNDDYNLNSEKNSENDYNNKIIIDTDEIPETLDIKNDNLQDEIHEVFKRENVNNLNGSVNSEVIDILPDSE